MFVWPRSFRLRRYDSQIVRDLSRNNISGPLPCEIGNCARLNTLYAPVFLFCRNDVEFERNYTECLCVGLLVMLISMRCLPLASMARGASLVLIWSLAAHHQLMVHRLM